MNVWKLEAHSILKISLPDIKFKQYIFAIKSAIHQEQNILRSAF